MDGVSKDVIEFVRQQSSPLVGTQSAAKAVDRVSYTHDAMIDLLIECPAMSQRELAVHFGYTEAWISRIRNSDAFLARLAERKADIVDPNIALTLDEKFRAMANRSLDIVQEKLEKTLDASFALEALTVASKALGYGARQANLNVQNNFVVAMPTKAASPEDWAAQHKMTNVRSPALAAMVAEVSDAVPAAASAG